MKTQPPCRPLARPVTPPLDAVRAVLGHTLGVPVQMLRAQTALYGNLPRFDERAMLRIANALEHHFGIVIDEEDLLPCRFATVASLAAMVAEKLEE